MAQWQARLNTAQPTTSKAMVGLGVAILIAGLSQVECPLGEFLYGLLRMLLGVLPSMALAALQALANHGCEHLLWPAFAQLSGCWWTALLNLASAF